MAFDEFRIKGQLQIHYLSLISLYQDDGFGNLINTNNYHVSRYVMEYIWDKFYFVEG